MRTNSSEPKVADSLQPIVVDNRLEVVPTLKFHVMFGGPLLLRGVSIPFGRPSTDPGVGNDVSLKKLPSLHVYEQS